MNEKAKSCIWNAKDPLTRMSGETVKAYTALTDYFLMGAGRSFSRLWEHYKERLQDATDLPPTRRRRTLADWSTKYHWQERIEAAVIAEDSERRRIRLERRIQVDENDWKDGDQLRELARIILAEAPRYLKTTRRAVKGQTTVIKGADGEDYTIQLEPDREIITVSLDTALALRASKLASNLQREAVGASGRQAKESWNVDLSTLSTDQLTRLAAGEDLINVLLAPGSDGGIGTPSPIG